MQLSDAEDTVWERNADSKAMESFSADLAEKSKDMPSAPAEVLFEKVDEEMRKPVIGHFREN